MNETAHAKNALLGGDTAKAIRHIDAALSSCFPLLGMDHPMASEVAHVSPTPLLTREDMSLPGTK